MKQGKLAAGSNTDIARGLIGAGVVKGAPKPDISSEAAFKAALLSAKSIAVTDPASGGSSGVYFGKLFEQMGLAQSLKPKLKLAAGGTNGYAATFVVKGEAEFALQPIPELMAVPGIEVVGPAARRVPERHHLHGQYSDQRERSRRGQGADQSPRGAIVRRNLPGRRS